MSDPPDWNLHAILPSPVEPLSKHAPRNSRK